MPDTANPTRRRSGSETRQRTDVLTLRMSPAESAALTILAQQHGHSSRQALIRDALQLIAASRTPG
ncbi:hypothetical protein D2E30_19310 [Mycobacteroides abscessus]|nr:hypothetical protein DDJ88_13825 [Mycobacteroides abscessus]PVA43446.1 hypothetical protein DDJ35_22655 [Mycobacteroides abscessus]PVA73602.1 hypothetical protein DDJ37_14360 [Mycobacteroides abscessus]PVB12059.1 hypothetical protein DDJ40_17030 [Mycobacteroides abscessus]RIQ92310.1 hypothetical protein D2E34_04360 [Mycobacteroides abscessus]